MTKFTTFTILFLLFLFPAFMASLIKIIPNGDQPGYGDKGRVSIYGIRDFTQYFISTENNLTAIGTTIKNPNLNNKKEIIFTLYDEQSNLIRSVKLNGFNIPDGDFVKIIFDKIADSKGKKYYFTLSSPSANEEEVIEVFLINPTTEILTYIYDGKTYNGGIPMVTFNKPDSKLETIKLVYLNLLSKLLPLNFQKSL